MSSADIGMMMALARSVPGTAAQAAVAAQTAAEAAAETAQEVLESIPEDYTTLSNNVDYLKSVCYSLATLLDAEGKNLLNPVWLANLVRGNDPLYTLSGDSVTVEWSDYSPVTASDKIMVLDAGTYTISFENSCRCGVFVNGTKIADFTGTSKTFTVDNDNSNVYLLFLASSYPYVIGHIQIEKGSTATTYTPYGLFLESKRIVNIENQLSNN